MEKSIGAALEKGYEVDRLIGEGGFGQVYHGHQKFLNREVAVKVILPRFANQPIFVQRFQTEAQIVARIEHPHIVPLYDYWREPDGAFLVMRWLNGGDLRHLLKGEQISTIDAIRIIEQVGLALSAAHRRNVVHRDLKPENILLDKEGNAYLTDFGIAKDLSGQDANEGEALTGSPAYIAPEQLMGEPATLQSDVYSLGIILYELLTWERPFLEDTVNSLIAHQLNDPVPPLVESQPKLPPSLDVIVQKATAKSPFGRYANAMEMVADLRQVLHQLEYREADVASSQRAESIRRIEDVENPFKGLRPFETFDADSFFGREGLVHDLLNYMSIDHPLKRFVAIVGPSGIGKSSVVKAGLLPALKHGEIDGSQNWFITEFTPGLHPIRDLTAALLRVAVRPIDDVAQRLEMLNDGLVDVAQSILPSVSHQIVLVIDQFEEVFTLAEDPREAQHFLDLLVNAVKDPRSPVWVIITLRADFYDRPLLVPSFSELISQRTVVVRPLNPEELERAIVEPLNQVGVAIENVLVEAIIDDVKEEPGALPLLQYALTELFDRGRGGMLTLASYQAIGQVSGALARRADDTYNKLDATSQALAKQLFLRLVTLGEGKEDTRRRVQLQELLQLETNPAQMQTVIDTFGKHRLLTFDRDPSSRAPTVEIAHEAMINNWKRFAEWLDAERENIRQQRRLAILADEWQSARQDSSFLLRGVQLSQFEIWAEKTDLVLTGDEAEYLYASLSEREKQAAIETERLAKEAASEARARRFQRNFLIVLSIATPILFLLAIFALLQREDARKAQNDAEHNASTAVAAQALAVEQAGAAATAAAIAENRANELQSLAYTEQANQALTGSNPDLALPLVLAANELENPPILAQRLLGEIVRTSTVRLIDTRGAHLQVLTSVDVNGEGQALTSSSDGSLVIWDLASGTVVTRISTGAGQIPSAIFAPDGMSIFAAASTGQISQWDVASGEVIREFTGHTDGVLSLALSRDGTRLVSGSRDKTIILWDIATGEAIQTFEGHTERVTAVAFSPTGNQILSGGADNQVIFWAVEDSRILYKMNGHTQPISSVAINPLGTQALSSSVDGVIRLWDLTTGQITRTFEGHADPVTSITFSPDGQYALSSSGSPFAGASKENGVFLWEIQTGLLLDRFQGHTNQVTDAVFTPDGRNAVSVSGDLTLRVWAVVSDLEIHDWRAESGIVAFDLYQDGQRAALISADSALVLFDVASNTPLQTVPLESTSAVNAVAVSHDGRFAVTAGNDRLIKLWVIDETSAEFGTSVREFAGHLTAITSVAWSPDDRFILSAGEDRQMILWDASTGEEVRHFETLHTNIINDIAFSPDGTLAVSASSDRTLIVWDVATGERIERLLGHDNEVTSVAFDPFGETIVSGSRDNTLIHWDATTGNAMHRLGDGANNGHSDWVLDVRFSADGQQILSSSRDRSLRIWDADSGQEIRRIGVGLVTDIAISPDDQIAFSSDSSGRFQQWAFSINALIDWTRQHRYVHDLTCSEREQFNVLPLCPAS